MKKEIFGPRTDSKISQDLEMFLKMCYLTCDDASVEVESHLAAVLEDDGLHQVAVPLQPDLVSLAPLPGVHQPCSNTNINMHRRLSSRFHTIGICKGCLLIMSSNNLVEAKTNQPLVKIFSDTFIIVS